MEKNTAEIVEESENVKNNDNSRKKSIKTFLKDNLKLNIEDISTKKLEFSLNKLPETKLIEVDNLIDYKTPLYLSQRINTNDADIIKSAIIWPKDGLVVTCQQDTMDTTTEAIKATTNDSNNDKTLPSAIEILDSGIETPIEKVTETNITLNESDYKKIESKLEYGRPPPSAPRLSLESSTSLMRHCEHMSAAVPTISSRTATNQTGFYNNNDLANHRNAQATSIPSSATRVYTRSIESGPKWNDYYDSIRLSENYNDYRKRFENDERNINVPDYKNNNNKNCNELRNKRIDRVKEQDEVISNHLAVERGFCKNHDAASIINRRDQECQFPSPCARCLLDKKLKVMQNKSPLSEDVPYPAIFETGTQTQNQFTVNAQKILDSCQKNILKFSQHNLDNGKPHNVKTPQSVHVKKGGYYNFLTPLLNDNQNKEKQQAQQHHEINKQTSSTPTNDCNQDSIDKETSTNLINEDKSQQYPSPSFNNVRKVVSTSIDDKQCPCPTTKPQLRRYVIDTKDDEIVDFNNKNTQCYEKFLKRINNEHDEQIEMKEIQNHPTKTHTVKFSDVKEDKNQSIPIILPSKQTQTFYNGYKVWKTPTDLILASASK